MKLSNIFSLLALLVCWSCQNKEIVDKPAESEENPQEVEYQRYYPEYPKLAGTKWKLYFVFDDRSFYTVYRNFELKDCEDCYSLYFDTDYTATLYSTIDTFHMDLSQPDLSQSSQPLPERWREGDVSLYEEDIKKGEIVNFLIRTITSTDFRLTLIPFEGWKGDLRFLSEPGYWTIFIPYEDIPNIKPPVPRPVHLTGTKWKFVGNTPQEPKNCEDCYTLTFIADDTVKIQMISRIIKLDLWEHIILSDYYVLPTVCGQDIACYEYYGDDGITYDCGIHRFLCDLYRIKSYTATDELLKVFSGNNPAYYLPFIPIK